MAARRLRISRKPCGHPSCPELTEGRYCVAAIALYLTCGDGEWGAEVYRSVADRQQALHYI